MRLPTNNSLTGYYKNYLLRKLLYILSLFLFFVSGIQARLENKGGNTQPTYKVLILHSYTDKLTAYAKFGQQVQLQLKEKGINTTLRTFYLDCERFNSHDEEERMYNFLDSIASWEPDIILVNDDQATYSLMACDHPIVKKVPVIFSAVNFPNRELLKQYPNIRGFWDKPDYLTTIRLIEKLYGSSRILFFRTSVYIGRQAFYAIQKQLEGSGITIQEGLYNSRIPFPGEPQPKDSIHSQIYTTMTADLSARQLLWIFEDKPYTACLQIILDFNVLTIGRLANVPNFTVINNGFNDHKGVTGGYFTTLDIQVNEVADAVSKVLKGTSIYEIPPIRESKKTYAFDWNELERFHIDRADLPAGSIIYNMPFHVRYHMALVFALGSFLLLIMYIIIQLTFMYKREYKRKKLAQENLLKEKNFLKLALEGGNTYAWRLEYGNFIFEKDFFTANNMAPRPVSFRDMLDIIHPDDQDNFCYHIREVFSGKQSKATIQCRFNFSGTGYTWWELRYNHGDEQNNETTIIGICLNIQGFKDKENRLTILQEKAEEANKMKTAFLANMSHEIRTPLNAIVGFTNLLQEETDLSEEEKVLFKDTINKNSTLLLQLINDILELSRIESGRMSFTIEKYNVKNLLDDIYQTHRFLVPAHLQFLKDIPDLPVTINVDRTRFIQVITNFINNAIKFTPKGHILLGYTFNSDEKQVSIFVEDTGIGMSEEAQQKVFDRFYKQNEFAQGTGLGLSICKTIIERLEGDIILTSAKGKGSRFTVKLPLQL